MKKQNLRVHLTKNLQKRSTLKNADKKTRIIYLAIILVLTFAGCKVADVNNMLGLGNKSNTGEIEEYSGSAYTIVNDNVPYFDESDYTEEAFEEYEKPDRFGRCGVAYANVCKELMPTEERGAIGQVKPTGWQTIKFDFVDGKYLYNRCHLIGFQLTGENANESNLITGTRYLNVEGMLPFENMVADYVKETNNHVLYRVTPVYEGDELVARGVLMEALSVEDEGEGICFNVFCYNVQPGVDINYLTGEARIKEEHEQEWADNETSKNVANQDNETTKKTDHNNVKSQYVINKKSGKFHLPECSGVATMSDKNRIDFTGNYEDLIEEGYEPCGNCNP